MLCKIYVYHCSKYDENSPDSPPYHKNKYEESSTSRESKLNSFHTAKTELVS